MSTLEQLAAELQDLQGVVEGLPQRLAVLESRPEADAISSNAGGAIGAGAGGAVLVDSFGARGDVKTIADAEIQAGTKALASPGTPFLATDLGKLVDVQGAGAAGAVLIATIVSVAGGVATLSVAAGTNVAGASCTYGTDDTAAIVRAIAKLPAGGSRLVLSAGKNYGALPIEGGEVGAFSLPAGCVVDGPGATVTAFATALPEGKLFFVKTGTARFVGLTMVRVLTEKIVVAVQGGKLCEAISFASTTSRKFTYAAKTWAKSTTLVTMREAEIEGEKSVSKEGSMGIHMPGALGAMFLATDCYIHDTGEPGGEVHNHGVYLFEPVAYIMHKVRFDHHKGGRFMQSFGTAEAGELTAANAPAFCIISSCTLGSDIELTNVSGSIATNCLTTTQILGTAFNMAAKAIAVQGDVIATNNTYPNGNDVATRMVKWEEVFGGGGVFPPTGFETTWSGQSFKGKSRGAFEPLGHCRITASSFTDTSAEGKHIKGLPGCYLEVSDNTFKGAKPALQVEGASTLKAHDNRFAGTAAAIEAEAENVLVLANNDFSQTGASLVGAPTSVSAFGNFGSKGLPSSGTAKLAGAPGKITVASALVTATSRIVVTQRSGAVIKTGIKVTPEAGKFTVEAGEASEAEIAWALVP